MSTNDISSTPSFIGAFKEAFSWEGTNFNKFDHLIPSNLGVQDEVIPNEVFDFRLMPMFLIEHPVVTLTLVQKEAQSFSHCDSFDHCVL